MSPDHWLIAPVLLPFAAGIALLAAGRLGLGFQRKLGLAAAAAGLALAAKLLLAASGGDIATYALGGWPAPFGIGLVLDRLGALMLAVAAAIALGALAHACTRGDDAHGAFFHPLFQFQLMGLNGAFLTGDLFNLFVFFEVLLIASYGLQLHGGGARRARAGLRYVVLNLLGSALFLIALGTLYGIAGTLNLADLAVRFAALEASQRIPLEAAAGLLLVVFGLKAALAPLHLWLPETYARAPGAVAALFAVMTKVGAYAILRVFPLGFGPDANPVAPWLLPLALATHALGVIGALAAAELRRLLAWLVVASVGTLLAAVGLFSEAGIAAALVYLVHSSLIAAGLFLLADLLGGQRGPAGDALHPAPPLAQASRLGALFVLGAVAVAGLPPLSGFTGKLLVLQAFEGSPALAWGWGILLGASIVVVIALARAGSALFWHTEAAPPVAPPLPWRACTPTAALLAAGPLLALAAAPLADYAQAAARQLLDAPAYVDAVLATPR